MSNAHSAKEQLQHRLKKNAKSAKEQFWALNFHSDAWILLIT